MINLLEFEIKRVQELEKKPGWSKWAFIGSLATLFWLITSEFQKYNININNLIFLLVAISFVFDFIRFFLNITLPIKKEENTTTRFFISKIFLSQLRYTIIFEFLRSTIIILLSISYYNLFNKYQILPVFIIYSVYAIFLMIFFILSFINVHMPISPNIKYNKYRNIIPIIYALSVLVFILFINVNILQPTIIEYRISVLIIGFTYILYKLSYSSINNIFLDDLVAIRRDIGLDKIDIDSAKYQTEIALIGLTVNDIFKDRILSISKKIKSVNFLMEDSIKKIDAIYSIYDKNKETSEAEKTMISATLESLTSSLKNISEGICNFKKEIKEFNKDAKILLISSPGVIDDLTSIGEKIGIELNEITKRSEELMGKARNAKLIIEVEK